MELLNVRSDRQIKIASPSVEVDSKFDFESGQIIINDLNIDIQSLHA